MKHRQSMVKQKGMSTLLVSIILLMAAAIITIYQSRNTIMNIKIFTKEYNHQLAEEIAAAGVEQAISYLSFNSVLVGSNTGSGWLASPAKWSPCSDAVIPCGDGTTAFYGNEMLVYRNVTNIQNPTNIAGTALTVHFLTPNDGGTGAPAELPIVKVIGVATADNGNALSIVRRTVRAEGLFNNSPLTPLTINGNATFVGGNFNVWGNSTGLNGSSPLSIWSGGNVMPLSGSAETYNVASVNGTYPSTTQTLSNSTTDGGDIVDNDPNFPSDLLYHFFGIPKSEISTIQQNASVVAGCGGLNANSSGLIWVTGSCSINGSNGGQIGSQANPVVLFVDNAFSMSSNTHFYGMIYITDNSPSVSLTGTVDIHGALVVDKVFNKGAGNVNLHYDPTTLSNANMNGSTYNYVLGSWGDTQ